MSTMADRPTLSVVMPSFQQGEFLEEAILSVLDQDGPGMEMGVELIVMDGGSTDGSVEILERYSDRLAYWVSQEDAGQSDALNRGFARSTGEVLAWLNSDDRYLPGTLEWVGRQFSQRSNLDWLAGSLHYIDAEGEFLGMASPEDARSDLVSMPLFSDGKALGGGVYQPATFFSRRLWDDCGPLDTSLHCCMDRRLWMEARGRGYAPRFVARPLAEFRIHSDSKTQSQKASFLLERTRIHASLAFQPGFSLLANLQLSKRTLVEASLTLCDRSIQERRPIRAALWLQMALVLSPSIIRRRLYSVREIAKLWFGGRT